MIIITLFLYLVVSHKPIYLVAGFGNSPIYSHISNPLIYSECPTDVKHFLIIKGKKSDNRFITAYPDCVAKLFRIQFNTTTKKVEQLPGIHINSSQIGEYSNFSDIFDSITPLFESIGYQKNINMFHVGYNYYFHPITSYSVYEKLKQKIEQVYLQTGEKSIFVSYDQGTSFVSIFLSNYSRLEWVNKYIDSVIFIEPTFAGLSTFPQLLTQTIPPFISTKEFKKSIMRMPGLHIRMPNYVIFENFSLSNNVSNKIDHFNASHAFEYLKELGKVDSESELIFKSEIEKFLKVPVPEPPIPSLIIYNDKKSDNINSLYACSKWRSTKCIKIHEKVTNDEILNLTITAKSIISYINSRSKSEIYEKRAILENNQETVKTATFSEASGKFNDDGYLNSHMVLSSKFEYSATKGMIDYPLTYAFDDKPSTCYLSSRANSPYFNNTISFNFTEKVSLEAFIFDPGFMNGKPQGFPLKTCVYASVGDEPFNLKVIFEGPSTFSDSSIQFVFPEIIECDHLKLEFVNVTNQEIYNSMNPIICDLKFIQYFNFECASIGSASNGIYNNSEYFSSHVINKTEFSITSSSEGVSNYPLSNVFDDDPLSYYISSVPNSDTFNNTVTITFSEEVLLEAFLYDPFYEDVNNSRKFHGFPTKVCIYSSTGNQPFSFNTIFIGWPIYSWSKIRFVFPQPIQCDKLKLEFVEVTEQTIEGYSKSPIIGGLQMIRCLKKPTEFSELKNNYTFDGYFRSHVIPTTEFSFSSSAEGFANYPLSNAFDDDRKTFFISSVENGDTFFNSIFINFSKKVTLEGIIYDVVDEPTFQGIPKILYVYESIENKPFSLNSIFVGNPMHPCQSLQFVFTEKVHCDKLKLEFIDLTTQNLNGNSKSPVIGGLHFMHFYESSFFDGVSGKYDDDSYIHSHMISNSNFTVSGPEGVDGFSISNAFDDDDSNTYYLSSVSNNKTFHNFILVNFLNNVSIEALVYVPKFDDNDNSRYFHGFPTGLKVYSSFGNNEFSLVNVFFGIPVYPWSRVQFVFTELVNCDKLKLEFVDLTNQTLNGNSKSPVITELYFIQNDVPKSTFSPSNSPLQTPLLPTEIPVDNICKFRTHCSYEGSDDKKILVVVKETNLTKIVYERNGGAILIKNAGILCENTSFSGCQSKNGGG